jgi:hypothetical protein
MAELAGRLADGFNTPATSPGSADLIETALAARRHDDSGDFLVTASASLAPRWGSEESGQRARLRDLGVTRLILGVAPPYDTTQITALGGMLNR